MEIHQKVNKSIVGQLVSEYDRLFYTDFRSVYTRLEGIHRPKSFYHTEYGRYMNKWRRLNE